MKRDEIVKHYIKFINSKDLHKYRGVMPVKEGQTVAFVEYLFNNCTTTPPKSAADFLNNYAEHTIEIPPRNSEVKVVKKQDALKAMEAYANQQKVSDEEIENKVEQYIKDFGYKGHDLAFDNEYLSHSQVVGLLEWMRDKLN